MLERMDAFFEARLDGYDAHMLEAGFGKVEVLENWGATYTLRAYKAKEPSVLDRISFIGYK